MLYSSNYDSYIGKITIVANNQYLKGLYIENQKYFMNSIHDTIIEKENDIIVLVKSWLDDYFSGKKPSIDCIPMEMDGSKFRKEVWDILKTIPYGKTITYNDIANQIASRRGIQRMSAQAIGGAVGHNPISIIIPCHRVVGSNGSLTGYAGGIDIKVKLLELEGVDMTRLFIPKKSTAL